MKVRVRHRVDKLAHDYEAIPTKAKVGMVRVVSDNIDYGRDLTRALARESAGKHGKHYHRAITSEMHGPTSIVGSGSDGISGEWGADVSKPQGGMEFERGSRNQKPHLDHQKAADRVVPSFAADTRRLSTRLFR